MTDHLAFSVLSEDDAAQITGGTLIAPLAVALITLVVAECVREWGAFKSGFTHAFLPSKH